MSQATMHDLQEQRAGLFEQMKGILDTADAESRDLSAEERQTYDQIETDLDKLGEQIEQIEGDQRRRERVAKLEDHLKQSRGVRTPPTQPNHKPAGDDGASEHESAIEAMQKAIWDGASQQEALRKVAQRWGSDHLKDVRSGFNAFISRGWNGMSGQEQAALQVDPDSSGGTMVVPEEFIARLIIGLDERVFMRQLGTVLPLTNADSIGVPSLENDPADADWTSELNIGGEDSTMSTGKRKLSPHPLGKLLKVSKTLLRKSAVPAESLVRSRLEFKFAVTEEKGFLTGTGAGQPLGVFTASDQGISTSQDVSTDNTTTNVTADGLINAKFALASQYLASANLRWVFHRTVVRNIRKLKDGNGQYLWTMGLAGEPDTILEVPYVMSEFAPSTFTSGSYVGLIGDLQWYWIAESLRMEMQRLDELYAATNQVGFIGRRELDGMPVLEEAFVRVKLA